MWCSASSKEKQIPEAKVVDATGNGEPTRKRNAHTSPEFAIAEKEKIGRDLTWTEQRDEMRIRGLLCVISIRSITPQEDHK